MTSFKSSVIRHIQVTNHLILSPEVLVWNLQYLNFGHVQCFKWWYQSNENVKSNLYVRTPKLNNSFAICCFSSLYAWKSERNCVINSGKIHLQSTKYRTKKKKKKRNKFNLDIETQMISYDTIQYDRIIREYCVVFYFVIAHYISPRHH